MTCLTITSFSVRRYRGGPPDEVPYAIINVTLKIDRHAEDGETIFRLAMSDTEEYQKTLSVDDPEKYLEWIYRDGNWLEHYPGHSHVWVHSDPTLQYIEKFQVFWIRDWISDTPVTRAILSELQHYAQHAKLPSVYRALPESIILKHLRTLSSYWD